jgi:hypothetical protein
MCLDTITKAYSKTNKSEGYGWKVITEMEGNHYCYNPIMWGRIFYNRWMKADTDTLIESHKYAKQQVSYQSGFHIFKNQEDAQNHWLSQSMNRKVKKVKYKNIICSGIQDGIEVLVVKKVMMLKK